MYCTYMYVDLLYRSVLYVCESPTVNVPVYVCGSCICERYLTLKSLALAFRIDEMLILVKSTEYI
jgi:hypothetical protein